MDEFVEDGLEEEDGYEGQYDEEGHEGEYEVEIDAGRRRKVCSHFLAKLSYVSLNIT